MDDSVIKRQRSKDIELLARVFDHVSIRFVRGYTLLTLGWSDGFSFVPLDFTLMSSSKSKHRFCEMKEDLDKRFVSSKRRMEALIPKPDAVVQMLERALKAGFLADYVLMDNYKN